MVLDAEGIREHALRAKQHWNRTDEARLSSQEVGDLLMEPTSPAVLMLRA